MGRKLLWLAIAIAWLAVGSAGCERPPAQAELATSYQPIVGGEPDPGHPAVGLLTSGGGGCSGTLITPSIVLTAAHCTNGVQGGWFTIYGADEAVLAEIKVKENIPHPDYGYWGASENPSDFDIGVAVLAEPATITPVALRTRSLECRAGTPLTFVGFGLTDILDVYSSGTKHIVQSSIKSVDAKTLVAGTTPGDPTCPCFGDSGGPALVTIGGRIEIVGVVSTGDWWCAHEDTLARVDSHADWLLEKVLEHDPGGLPAECGDGWCDLGEDGTTCAADCVGGAVETGDECAVDGDCAAPLHCRALSGQSICGELCPAPAIGAGCPCGTVCQPLDTSSESEGLCVATGFPAIACGNGECEAGESYESCPLDCTATPCHAIGAAGCCAEGVATWCEDNVLHQQHCATAPECGWSEAAGRYGCSTDGLADPSGSFDLICPPLGPKCGDGTCEEGEDMDSCFVDCPLPGYCGDGECAGYEYYSNCPQDCLKDKCDFFTQAGCCLNDTAVWCTGDGQYMASCGPAGGCGWSQYDLSYTCGPVIIHEEPSGAYPRACEEYSDETSCGDGECNGDEYYDNCPEDCLHDSCLFDAPSGCCDGATVNYCDEGKQYQASCAHYPYCGWSYNQDYYGCGTYGSPDPSGDQPLDCSAYGPNTCGDGTCQTAENAIICPQDCPMWGDCEDGLCGLGEDFDNCPQDCVVEGCEDVPPQACCEGNVVRYCHGNVTRMINCDEDLECGWLSSSGYYWCGTDGGTDPSGTRPRQCFAYSNPYCGDGWCTGKELPSSCPSDCSPPGSEDIVADLVVGDATAGEKVEAPVATAAPSGSGCSAFPAHTAAAPTEGPALLAFLLVVLLLVAFLAARREDAG
jgi:hypothetical protein